MLTAQPGSLFPATPAKPTTKPHNFFTSIPFLNTDIHLYNICIYIYSVIFISVAILVSLDSLFLVIFIRFLSSFSQPIFIIVFYFIIIIFLCHNLAESGAFISIILIDLAGE